MLAISSNLRLMCKIEQTLKGGAMTPPTVYNKEEIEAHKLEIQDILGILTAAASAVESRTPSTLL